MDPDASPPDSQTVVAAINEELHHGVPVVVFAPKRRTSDKERCYCTVCGLMMAPACASVIRRHCRTQVHKAAVKAMHGATDNNKTSIKASTRARGRQPDASAVEADDAPGAQVGSLKGRVEDANRLYHNGLPVLCVGMSCARCTLCDARLYKDDVLKHCQRVGHGRRFQAHLEEVAEAARRADTAATRAANNKYRRYVRRSEPLVDPKGRQAVVLLSTSVLSHTEDGVQTEAHMCWAPEVDTPRSNVHYVQSRLRIDSRRPAAATDSWAFRVLPVARPAAVDPTASAVGGNAAPHDGSGHPSLLVPSVLQHVASGLYVTAAFSPRGLLWLHDDVDRAAIVTFVPANAFAPRLKRKQGAAAPTKDEGDSRYVMCLTEQRIDAPTWVALVYAPPSGEQRPGDMGVSRRDRRSLVLIESSIARSAAFKADRRLYQFRIDVVDEPSKKRNRNEGRQKKRQHSTRHGGNPSDTSSASSVDDEGDASSASSALRSGSVGGTQATSPNATTNSSDDETSSVDESFLAEAMGARDAFSIFVRRRICTNYWQDRCIFRRRGAPSQAARWVCGPSGAKTFTVIGFGIKDPLIRSMLSKPPPSAGSDTAAVANCMLCVLSGGVPGSMAHCRIPVLVTTRAIADGEAFVVLAASVEKFTSTTDDFAWYMEHYGGDCAPPGVPPPQRRVPLIPPPSEGGSGGDATFVPWGVDAQYYYGNNIASAVPAREAVLEFPFNLTAVRPCMRLRGELEVVAKYRIPRGTCFMYCGPRIRAADDHEGNANAQSTAMRIDRAGRKIEGGNTMKYVNHHFGFASEGNVAFRRGAVVYRRAGRDARPPSGRSSARATGETHIIFFVATRDIAPGECLLAESYGPEYDSFIERIALCGGRFLSTEERALLHSDGVGGIEGTYHGCYVTDIHVGSIVGRRRPKLPDALRGSVTGLLGGDMVFYLVTTVADDNVVLGEELTVRFPFLFVRDASDDECEVAVLRKTEVVLFIPGWDYKDVQDPKTGRQGAKLSMPRSALDRVTYDDLL